MKLRNKKTGEVIETDYELSVSVPDGGELYGNHTYTQINGYSSIKELAEEWEDYEEPKKYWCIDTYIYELNWITEGENPDRDNFNREIGNYFETKEEAEKAVEKLKAFERLEDKGFRFGGWLFFPDSYPSSQERVRDGRILFKVKNDKEVGGLLDTVFGGEE